MGTDIKNTRVMRSRDKKANHVDVIVTGERSGEIGEEIRAALKRMECRHEVSYFIATTDYPQ